MNVSSMLIMVFTVITCPISLISFVIRLNNHKDPSHDMDIKDIFIIDIYVSFVVSIQMFRINML